MENYNEIRDDEIEIDLKELFLVLWRKAWIIILTAIFTGGIAFGYTNFLVVPQYESSSLIYILSSSTSLTSLTDLQISSALTGDYEILGVSRPVIEEVIENLELDYTYEQMVNMITITNPSDSHVMKITVTNPSATTAMNIANEMADVVSDRVASVMMTDTPTNVERAVAAVNPSSPNITKNTAIGILIGMVLAAGIIIVIHVLDDTIKNEDDVVKYLGKNVLATLPKEGSIRKEKTSKVKKTSTNNRAPKPAMKPAPSRTVSSKSTVHKSVDNKNVATKASSKKDV